MEITAAIDCSCNKTSIAQPVTAEDRTPMIHCLNEQGSKLSSCDKVIVVWYKTMNHGCPFLSRYLL
jgi:hypothetical protein